MYGETEKPETVDGFLEEVYARFKEAKEHQADWRKEAREDYAFVAGEQWNEEDLQVLREQLRPCITFNRVGVIMDAICGMEVTNRQEVRYIPREVGDAGVNEVLTGAGKWVRDECDAEDEESDAFLDSATCGMGWTETRMDYEDVPEGMIRIERVDPLEMYWDPCAKKRNLTDGRFVFRVKEIPHDEFKQLFPDAPDDCGASPISIYEDAENQVDNPKDNYAFGDKSKAKKKYCVLEYQWCERAVVTVMVDPVTRQAVEIDPKRFAVLQKQAAAKGIELKSATRPAKKYMRAFVCGKELLEYGPSPCKHGFTYKAITAKRDRNKNTWYGVVRAMKDPQRWANKWLSQLLHIVNTGAKGGLLAEQGAFVNPRKAEQEYAKAGSITWLRDGGLEKTKEKQAITYPSGMDKLMEYAISSIRDVSGVNIEMLGLADRNQPGILEQQRKQAGFTVLARLFDSLRRYRKEQGRLLMHFITEYISDERLIRIGEGSQAKYVPLVRQPDTAIYDVVVDEAPFSPNQKEQVWASLQQLMPVLLKAPVPMGVWTEIIKYTPLPESVTSKITEILSQPQPEPPEVQLKREELETQNRIAETNERIKGVDLEIKKVDLVKTMKEAAVREREMGMKEAEAEQTKAGAETQNTALDGLAMAAVALTEAAQAIPQAAQALMAGVAQMNAPKRKVVNVERAPDGSIARANIDELPLQ